MTTKHLHATGNSRPQIDCGVEVEMLFVVCVWVSLCPRCHRYRRNYAVNKKHIANIGQPTIKKHLWTTDQGCSGCLPAGNVSSHHQLLVVLGRRRAKVFNALHVHIVDCLSVCLTVCQSIYLSIQLSLSLSVQASASFAVSLSVGTP